MIYFAQPRDGGPIKIGFTTNLDARIENLQVCNHCRMVILGIKPGGRLEEEKIHRRFKHLQDGKNEWFKLDEELMAFIREPCAVDTVELSRDWGPKDRLSLTIDLSRDEYNRVRVMAKKYKMPIEKFAAMALVINTINRGR